MASRLSRNGTSMTAPSSKTNAPTRGEIWVVRFDPVEGAEMAKKRPSAVVSLPTVGRLPLRIIVPITHWKPSYAMVPWLVYLKPNKTNGLTKDSAADAFQVKSVSLQRFENKIGTVTADQLEQISAAVALCVGAP